MSNAVLERGLPCNLDAERFVLGSILLNGDLYLNAAGDLMPEDFSIEKHRRIFARMSELHERGERIDRVTVANELMRHRELESVDGLSYLVSLDDGLPATVHIDGYVGIVKDKSALRRIVFASQNMMARAIEGVEDSRQIIAGASETLLQLGAPKGGPVRPGEIIDAQEGGISTFLDPSRREPGLGTGYREFDRLTGGGLRKGELLILAARPRVGKSTLAVNIADHVAVKLGGPVIIFSLEMSRESLLERMLCGRAYVDHQKFRRGELDAEERRRLLAAASVLAAADLPLWIDDTASTKVIDIHNKARRIQAEHGLALVVVDYLQLMAGNGRYENRTQEVSTLSRGLKIAAKELKVPMIVLSQLNRAVESRGGDKRPQLSDLRESGSIEQDADMVAFIHREELYYPDRPELKGQAELILEKQRQGPSGKVPLVFLGEFYRFENMVAGDVNGGD